jgi:hypothetical protein
MARNKNAIPQGDVAFAYELRCEGYPWKVISRYLPWHRNALAKAIAKRMKEN